MSLSDDEAAAVFEKMDKLKGKLIQTEYFREEAERMLRDDIKDRVQGFASDGVDVIFASERYIIEQIMKLRVKSSKPIQVIHVNHMGDLKAMSVVAMRELGWVRDPYWVPSKDITK